MDDQRSQDLKDVAKELKKSHRIDIPEVKRSNRAERAIRTAKNHIIVPRAGFHPDCSHAILDKCLTQMELTLNIIHPFEYDETISAYHGAHGSTCAISCCYRLRVIRSRLLPVHTIPLLVSIFQITESTPEKGKVLSSQV
jgi:hypothetical protein